MSQHIALSRHADGLLALDAVNRHIRMECDGLSASIEIWIVNEGVRESPCCDGRWSGVEAAMAGALVYALAEPTLASEAGALLRAVDCRRLAMQMMREAESNSNAATLVDLDRLCASGDEALARDAVRENAQWPWTLTRARLAAEDAAACMKGETRGANHQNGRTARA